MGLAFFLFMDSDEDGNMAKRTRRQGRLLNEYEQLVESNITEDWNLEKS